MAPGNNESAGKRLSGTTRKGSKWLPSALVEMAHAAGRREDSYLGAQYRRLAARRGKKKAAVAVGHGILVIAYHLLKEWAADRDLGPHYFDLRDRDCVAKRLVERLKDLGYRVSAESIAAAA